MHVDVGGGDGQVEINPAQSTRVGVDDQVVVADVPVALALPVQPGHRVQRVAHAAQQARQDALEVLTVRAWGLPEDVVQVRSRQDV